MQTQIFPCSGAVGPLIAGHMRKQRFAEWLRRRLVQIKQSGQNPPISAAIQNKFRRHIPAALARLFNRDLDMRIVEIARLRHLRHSEISTPRTGDCIRQRLIKIRPGHLERIWPAIAGLLGEIEIACLAPAKKYRSGFLHELLIFHRLQATPLPAANS